MYHVVVNGFQNRINQFFTQLLALAINIHITSAAEIDAFKRAGLLLFRLIDLCQTHLSFLIDQNSLSWKKFMYAVGRYVQSSLYNRTLRSQYHDFIIHIPESRTNSPGITNGKTFTATGQTADDISPIPFRT